MPENNDYLNQVSASGSTYDVHDVRVPEVTASNNGKILKVLDGSWGMADESTFSIPTVTVAASQFSGTYPLYQIQLTTEQKAIVANEDNKFLNLNLSAVETLSGLNTLQISRVVTATYNTNSTVSKFIATVMAVISPETNEDETVNGEPAAPFRLAWNYDSSDADYLYLQVYKLARADQVVHYTQSDEKEDWEKETARTNIGAAPLVPTIAVKDSTITQQEPFTFKLTSSQKEIVENRDYTAFRINFYETPASNYAISQVQRSQLRNLNANENTNDTPSIDMCFESAGINEEPFIAFGYSYLYNNERYVVLNFYTVESASNKVTSISSSSTDTQYPSAKCVYDNLASKITNPSGGTTGQILTKTASGEAWDDAPISSPAANTVATASGSAPNISLTLPTGETAINGKHISFSAPCASTGVEGIKFGEDGNWTTSYLPSSQYWWGVTYGNGKFVAISYNNSNVAAYSTNGTSWIATTMPSSEDWCSITHGNGKYVAISSYYSGSTVAAYSTDGITWATSTLPSADWRSVTYGNGKFVAVAGGPSSTSAYSTDGITWTASTMPSSVYWNSITYGNGKFVAVASRTSAYSTDGINWTASTIPESSGDWEAIAYGNGKFVAISFDSRDAACSTDGITWTASTLPYSTYWGSIAYGNGKFIAISRGSASDASAYSADGINWTGLDLPLYGNYYSVAFGNGKFVTVRRESNNAAYLQTAPTYQLVNAEGNAYVANGGSWSSGAYLTTMLDVTNSKAYVVNEHGGGLPAVTSADEGKVLQVNASGVWDKGETEEVTLVDIPNIPSATAADNGKLMGVANGVWAKVDAPSGLVGASGTLTTSGWAQDATTGAYAQTVSIPNVGLTSNSNVIVDCALSMTDLDADVEVLTAWGNVNNCVAGTNTLTFYCYATVPTVAIPVSVVIGG